MQGLNQTQTPGEEPQGRIKVPSWCFNGEMSGFYAADVPCIVDRVPGRVVLLNAIVAPTKWMAINALPTDVGNAIAILRAAKEIVSYIGHPATAQLLSQLVGREIPLNRGEYVPQHMDLAVVVRLRKRLQSPGDVANVSITDLDFLLLRYYDVEGGGS